MKRWVLITAVSSEIQVEGESLFDQMRKLREACAQYGGKVIDEIEVPGFRRTFIDWHELKAAAGSEGITSFQRIEDHWKARDFDVMASIDTTRLWRTDALTVYGMARIYEAGGVLYTIRDGFIDAANRSMFSLMAGFQTQKEIESLKTRWRSGMRGRIKRGLGIGKLPFTHRYIYGNKGEAIGVELDPAHTRLFAKVAELFLDGVSYPALGRELHSSFGLVSPATGQPFVHNAFQRIFWTPSFWGHATIGYEHVRTGASGYGDWVFGDIGSVPEGLDIQYDAFAPVYAEPLRSEMIAEIKRRQVVNKGRANKRTIHRFSGLLKCGVCGSIMTHAIKRRSSGAIYDHFRCPQCKVLDGNQTQVSITSGVIQAQMIAMIFNVMGDSEVKVIDHTEGQIATLLQDISRVEGRIDRVIDDKLDAAPEVAKRYDERLRQLNDEITVLRSELASLRSSQYNAQERLATRGSAIRQIREVADEFWTQPDHQINRLLHLLMGTMRYLVKNGEIIGIVSHHQFARRK